MKSTAFHKKCNAFHEKRVNKIFSNASAEIDRSTIQSVDFSGFFLFLVFV